MVLTLADFDDAGLDVLCLALIESGMSDRGGGEFWIYTVSPSYTPAVGTLSDGDLEYTSGATIVRIRLRSGGRVGLNNTGGNFATFFRDAGGEGVNAHIYFQVEGQTRRVVDFPADLQSTGGAWLNTGDLGDRRTWIDTNLTSGTPFIFAIANEIAEYASFEATAGSPTATFGATFITETSFEAEAGSPTATFAPEAVTPTAKASFEARAGTPTARFQPQHDHTSDASFEAEAGSPTATFAAEAIVPPSRASFAAEAGTPSVTIDVDFDHETRIVLDLRAGSPTVSIIPEAIRTRDPAAEALAHQVDHVNLTTTYKGDRMAEPLEKRAWDVRTYEVSLGEALADTDVISRVDEVAVVDDRGVPVAGYSTTGITSSAGIVTFTCSGGDMGDEHRVRIRCPLTGGTQRIEVTVPLKVLA